MENQPKQIQMPSATMTKKILHNEGITKKTMPEAGMTKKVMPGAGMTKKMTAEKIAIPVSQMTIKNPNSNDSMVGKVSMTKEALIQGKSRDKAVSGKSY